MFLFLPQEIPPSIWFSLLHIFNSFLINPLKQSFQLSTQYFVKKKKKTINSIWPTWEPRRYKSYRKWDYNCSLWMTHWNNQNPTYLLDKNIIIYTTHRSVISGRERYNSCHLSHDSEDNRSLHILFSTKG